MSYRGTIASYFVLQLAFVFFASDAYLLRVDDAYYYFGIARSVVETGTFTFDGIHATNGFQALWQFVLIGVTYLAGAAGVHDPGRLIYVYFVVCAVLNTLSGLVAIGLARRIYPGDSRAVDGFVFAVLWLPGLTASLLSGMENSLNWLLLLALVRQLLDAEGRPALPRGTARLIALVVTSALTVYARLDNALILALMAVWFLWRDGRARAGTVFGWGLATMVLVVPLFVWQMETFATPVPISGAVKAWKTREIVEAYGVWNHLLRSVKSIFMSAVGLPVAATLMGYYEIIKPPIIAAGLARVIGIAGVALAVVLAAAAWGWKRGMLRAARIPSPPALPFLSAVAGVHLVVSSILFPQQWGYAGLIWYFLIEYLAMFTLAGWWVSRLSSTMSPALWRNVQRVAVVLLVVSIVPMLMWRPSAPTEQQLKRRGAQWMNENLPETAVASAFSAGVTGYFARNPVVNLDGLVNDRRFFEDYLVKHRVRNYLVDEGITHIAEHVLPTSIPGWYWRWVYIPDEARILFREEGNEVGLDFGVVAIDSLRLEER